MNYLIVTCLILLTSGLSAQDADPVEADSSDRESKAVRLFALPIVFYGPETRLGFGAAGAMAFRWPHSSPSDRPSQLQLGFAYTLNNQILLYLPYQIFTRNEQFIFSGELGYYRYFFYYYGIGNDAWEVDRETYEVTFPRLRFRGTYRFYRKNFFGLQYWYDNFQNLSSEPGGILASSAPTGVEGGAISGLGPIFLHDSRNNVFAPWKGWYVEAGAVFHGSALGSDFQYQKYSFDARHYLFGTPRHTLAVQLYGEFTGGNPPFYQLALLGGTRRMRGVVEGRLRDRHFLMGQVEWRQHLFWRIGMVGFLGYGGVSSDVSEFQLSEFRLVGGLGLRVLLLEEDRINVRVDYGIGKGTSGLYLTVAEAF